MWASWTDKALNPHDYQRNRCRGPKPIDIIQRAVNGAMPSLHSSAPQLIPLSFSAIDWRPSSSAVGPPVFRQPLDVLAGSQTRRRRGAEDERLSQPDAMASLTL